MQLSLLRHVILLLHTIKRIFKHISFNPQLYPRANNSTFIELLRGRGIWFILKGRQAKLSNSCEKKHSNNNRDRSIHFFGVPDWIDYKISLSTEAEEQTDAGHNVKTNVLGYTKAYQDQEGNRYRNREHYCPSNNFFPEKLSQRTGLTWRSTEFLKLLMNSASQKFLSTFQNVQLAGKNFYLAAIFLFAR